MNDDAQFKLKPMANARPRILVSVIVALLGLAVVGCVIDAAPTATPAPTPNAPAMIATTIAAAIPTATPTLEPTPTLTHQPALTPAPTPTLVPTLTPISTTLPQASAGDWHTCAIQTSGRVACWGSNEVYPIGEDNYVDFDNGRFVGQSMPPEGDFRQISSGASLTCGVKTNGIVKCWGSNDKGQATPPAGIFQQVSVGAHHTCGLRTSGIIDCWGGRQRWSGYSPNRYIPAGFGRR
jgi:hypothetical protein